MVIDIFLAVCAFVALGFGLKRLVNWIGFPCQFCEKKVSSFDQIPAQDQNNILVYFRDYERREPDKDGLFVCTHCQTVHDDFSGEKQSRDIDVSTCKTFCKVCSKLIIGCEPSRGIITCQNCGTQYQWHTHESSGFRFFMPPQEAKLLNKCPHGLDSW
jgi:hypothetical protein